MNLAYDSEDKATSLACVKSLLFQLLERSVGNVKLYEHLVRAFDTNKTSPNKAALEASLWAALRTGLQVAERGDATFVLLTDGCDAISGEKTAIDFVKTLKACVTDLPHSRTITFSRQSSHISQGSHHIEIKERVHDDIMTHLRQVLSESKQFNALKSLERRELVSSLTKKAKGNFLWAFFAARLLRDQSTPEKLTSAAHSISSEIKAVLSETVTKLKLETHETLKLILSFMLISTRPLGVREVEGLLSVNLDKKCLSTITIDVSQLVSQEAGGLIIINGGHLHFRSSLVQSHVRELAGKSLPSIKDSHAKLTYRMLLYARLTLTSYEYDVSMDELDLDSVSAIFQRHSILEYIVQRWIFHCNYSGFLTTKGELSLPNGFKDIFPASVTFPLLERSCWAREKTTSHHDIALRVRELCFGYEHRTVLQSLITIGYHHYRMSSTVVEHSEYFYKAVKLGQTLLSTTSAVVASCARIFLSWTETCTMTIRTKIVTFREEVIRVQIQICKHRHGESSDEVISWYEKLIKLYIDIKEETNATAIYRELQVIIIRRFGKGSAKAREISKFFGTLDIVLKGETAEKDVRELEDLVFETSEEYSITDHVCITMMLKLARSYIVCGKISLAERLYVSLWRRISIACRGKSHIDMHVTKIRIALEYAEFLKQIKRTTEASNILICLWAEYEHHECEDKTLIICIRDISKKCRAYGLLGISISILKKVWSWFKSRGKGEDEEAQRTTVLITEVVEEITETTVTEKTTTITTTEQTETVTREIFEMHLTRCKKTKVDHAFFSACFALVGILMKQSRWSEATTTIERTLEITWKAVLTADVKITLHEHMSSECILITRRLAQCYHRQGHFGKAEHLHLRIYYACLYSLKLEDACFHEALNVLVAFYEEHHRHERVIEIYVELLAKYRKNLGHTHKLTIKTLYLLANQCKMLGRYTEACGYFFEIVTVLNKGSHHCHRDAFEAALFLRQHYHTCGEWVKLQDICSVLWETIVHHRNECTLTEEILVAIYESYSYVLEFHAKVEFKVLYEITVKYREVTTTVFGKDSSAVILALIALAKICEKREEHYHESITIYEEVIKRTTTTKTTTTTITERTVQTVKKRLSKMYVTVITTGKGASTTTTTFERALSVCIETFEHLKIELGCWHETTIRALKDVICLYYKSNTKGSHEKILHLLQTNIIEIISVTTTTTVLFTAAKILASIYIEFGFGKQGMDLLSQLRHVLIFRDSFAYGKDVTVKFNKNISKSSFVFLISFEQGLCGQGTVVFQSDLMADIILESLLFEEYTRTIEHTKDIHIILESGAKLRVFWEEHNRVEYLKVLDSKLLSLFKTHFAASLKGSDDVHIHLFYLSILTELSHDHVNGHNDFAAITCKAGNAHVRSLLEKGEFQKAQRLGHCVYHFANSQTFYHRQSCLAYGYKLAELLAGIDVPHPTNDAALSKAMRETSMEIMAEVLAVFHDSNLQFTSLRLKDLVGLIRLLGAQRNFVALEALLLDLWQAREVMQKSLGWSTDMILGIGKLLVHAQHGNKNNSAAIDTAELLYYNLRRSRGQANQETRAMLKLLTSLYEIEGHTGRALAMHESALQGLVSECHGRNGGATKHKDSFQSAEVRLQLELLRAVHSRNKSWVKPEEEMRDLYCGLKEVMHLDLPDFGAWQNGSGGKGAEGFGKYEEPAEWKIPVIMTY